MSRESSDKKISEFLGTENIKIKIPIYQRTYCWRTELVEDLFNDLYKINKGDNYHLGEIAFIEVNDNDTPEYHLVDGQQRITTIFLLKLAQYRYILKFLEENNYKDSKIYKPLVKNLLKYLLVSDCNIDDSTLFNNIQSFTIHEMKLNTQFENQNNLLISLLNCGDCSDKKHLLYKNYLILYNKIKEYNNQFSLIEKEKIINTFGIFTVQKMDNNYEEGYKFFVNVNKQREIMTDVELIRAYFLFDESTIDVMSQKWIILNNLVGSKKGAVNRFIKTYLLFNSEYNYSKINNSKIYNNLVEFIHILSKKNNLNINDSKIYFLDDVIKWGTYFNLLTNNKSIINNFFYDINKHNEFIKDLLLFIYFHYKENMITENEYKNIIDEITKIVFIIEINLNLSLNKGEIYRNLLSKIVHDLNHWEDEIKNFKILNSELLNLNIVKNNLLNLNFYKFKFNKQILSMIELFLDSESNNSMFNTLMTLTLEHIHPQKCDIDIVYDDNISDEVINTIGNLTLTTQSKNTLMGNDNWNTKKIRLCNCERPYAINNQLKEYSLWNHDTIKERGEWYWSKIVKVFNLK